MTGQGLATAVLLELNRIDATETPSAADAAFVLGKANRILERWNLIHGAAYCTLLQTFTLTPGLNPHTLGPIGATLTGVRPIEILSINLIDGDSRYPIAVHPGEDRTEVPDPESTGDPTDLYYDPTNPNGSLYWYPVPSSAREVEILSRATLTALTLTGVMTMPDGYEDALILTTAESCARAFSVPVPAELANEARDARARIWSVNTHIPRLDTCDSGMPCEGGNGGRSNIYTGR